MSKIEIFEKKMIKYGMSDEDFEEYKKLLKRVHSHFSKRQHCYNTAIQFPAKYANQAIKLIEYGLNEFEDSWFSTYTSYLFIGNIYESINMYQNAYDSYLLAMKYIEGKDIYKFDLCGHLCWMRLHIDSFQYSKELEDLYNIYNQIDDFSKGFMNDQFRLSVIQLVIALHHNHREIVEDAYKQVMAIYSPSIMGKFHNILIKHKYKETLKITPEVEMFIKRLNL